MSQTLAVERRRVHDEFRWFAAVGMMVFLIAAVFGSPVVMTAGLMMWGGFGMLARRYLPDRYRRPSVRAPRTIWASDGRPGRREGCSPTRAGTDSAGLQPRETSAAGFARPETRRDAATVRAAEPLAADSGAGRVQRAPSR